MEYPKTIWVDSEAKYFAKYEGVDGYEKYIRADQAEALARALESVLSDWEADHGKGLEWHKSARKALEEYRK